jgi:hypothetical protein
MQEAFHQARGAVGVHTTVVDLTFGLDDFAAADRAAFREVEFLFAARVVLVLDDFDDLGDDVTAALDFDVVTNKETKALYLVGVVQGGTTDGGSANKDRG